jgi:hypothetical protein
LSRRRRRDGRRLGHKRRSSRIGRKASRSLVASTNIHRSEWEYLRHSNAQSLCQAKEPRFLEVINSLSKGESGLLDVGFIGSNQVLWLPAQARSPCSIVRCSTREMDCSFRVPDIGLDGAAQYSIRSKAFGWKRRFGNGSRNKSSN